MDHSAKTALSVCLSVCLSVPTQYLPLHIFIGCRKQTRFRKRHIIAGLQDDTQSPYIA